MPLLSIKRYPRGSQKKPLIIVISKKVAALAVQRNKIRRRIRVIMSPIIKNSANDYVVVARTGIQKLTFQELKQEIHKTLSPKT